MARQRHILVLVTVVSALGFLGLAACSSDSDSSPSDGSSLKSYCAAIQTFYDTGSPYTDSTLPADVGNQMADELVDAAKVAPTEVQSLLGRLINGDTYARDDFDLYNRNNCNVDTAALRFSS